MRARLLGLSVVWCGLVLAAPERPAAAAITAAQRKELAAVQKEINGVTALIKQKKYDEAEAALKSAEEKVEQIKTDAGVEDTDPAIRRAMTAINKHRGSLPVSFVEDVAPILEKSCLRCHAEENPRNGLRLDTFAGLRKGGQSGVPVMARNANASLLYRRLVAPQNLRMPKEGQPLDEAEIQTIATWIQQGANFDGKDENTPLGELGTAKDGAEPVVMPEPPTGNETVSFTNDIAPVMVNLCLRCHSGARPRGGLSLETFEKLMQGGESGRVVVGGNLEGSRLWLLVGQVGDEDENPKMPPGQAVITTKNYNDFKTWIAEGGKFDGKDPKMPLRELVPTPEELRAAELAKMTPEQWRELRKERAGEAWETTFPREEPQVVETAEFLIHGNVPEARLKQAAEWADAYAKTLRDTFNDKSEPLFKGRLAVFVIKDRFGYEEFNQIVNRRETPAEMSGHSVVSAGQEDAYVVVQDAGDAATSKAPGLKLSLEDHLTGAYLQRSGGRLPDWALRGTGLALALKGDSKNEYVAGLRAQAAEALRGVQKPEDIFADGTFSPSQVGAVGYTLVNFLMSQGGAPKYGQFIRAIQQGASVADAARGVYRAELRALATQYAASVAR